MIFARTDLIAREVAFVDRHQLGLGSLTAHAARPLTPALSIAC